MNGNVGTTWAASATTLEERCMAATAMPDALRQYRASHAEDILSATVEWKNRRNPLRDEDYQGIADALGDDASVVETVIADRERKLSGHVEPAWSVELQTILNRYDSEEERVERTGYATALPPSCASPRSMDISSNLKSSPTPAKEASSSRSMDTRSSISLTKSM